MSFPVRILEAVTAGGVMVAALAVRRLCSPSQSRALRVLSWMVAAMAAFGAIGFFWAAALRVSVRTALAGEFLMNSASPLLQAAIASGIVVLVAGWVLTLIRLGVPRFRAGSIGTLKYDALALTVCVALLVASLELPDSLWGQLKREDPAVFAYGYGPQPNRHVRYQPDVVMIGGGPKAIHGVSPDSLTWTIDGSAKGVNHLSVGKIMLASSRAVGRVVALERRDKDLAVTLAPVRFTEVIRDAIIDINTTIDPASLVDHQSKPPQVISQIALPSDRDVAVEPAVWRQGSDSPRLQRIDDTNTPVPDTNKPGAVKVNIGDWEVEPYIRLRGDYSLSDEAISQDYANKTAPPEYEQKARDPNMLVVKKEEKQTEFGMRVQYTAAKRLKCGWNVRLSGQNIRIRSHLAVADGQVDGPMTFVIDGIDRLNIGLLGGVENGVTDNVKNRIEVPWEKAFQLPPEQTYGVPVTLHFKLKFIVETAFSGANSTMWAGGQYKLAGPIGVEGGKVLKPDLTVEKPMIDNIHGIAVGVSGLVVAVEFRWLLGFGTEAAMCGPYVKVILSAGLSRGSFMGFMLGGPLSNPIRPAVDCRGVTIDGSVGFGIGIQIDKNWAPRIAALLPGWQKTEVELVENTGPFYHRSWAAPAVPLCNGPGG
jgi:hypothetical protein